MKKIDVFAIVASEILSEKISHTEERDGKFYFAVSNPYQKDEILVWDGERAIVAHPFSDENVTAEFCRHLKEAEKLDELDDEELVWELATSVEEEAAASLVGCEEAYEGLPITLILFLLETRGFTQRELDPIVDVAGSVGEHILRHSAIEAEIQNLFFMRSLDDIEDYIPPVF